MDMQEMPNYMSNVFVYVIPNILGSGGKMDGLNGYGFRS